MAEHIPHMVMHACWPRQSPFAVLEKLHLSLVTADASRPSTLAMSLVTPVVVSLCTTATALIFLSLSLLRMSWSLASLAPSPHRHSITSTSRPSRYRDRTTQPQHRSGWLECFDDAVQRVSHPQASPSSECMIRLLCKCVAKVQVFLTRQRSVQQSLPLGQGQQLCSPASGQPRGGRTAHSGRSQPCHQG